MMVKVTEIFDSIQGEGAFIGCPTTFVRLSGCNLRCRWCDTEYAQEADGRVFEAREILVMARNEHVCITGGEPLVQEIYGLVKMLYENGKKVTVETNCTIYDKRLDEIVFLYSVSPKLKSSVEAYDSNVFESYLKLDNVQFKFVISDDADFSQALDIVEKNQKFVRDKVVFQPQGMCSGKEYTRRLKMLAEKVGKSDVLASSNVRVLPQLHKIIWGNKRGV